MSTFTDLSWSFPPFMSPAQSFQNAVNNFTNCTWNDFEIPGNKTAFISNSRAFPHDDSYKSIKDLNIENLPILHWILAAVCLMFTRKLVERHIFLPIGKYVGIKELSRNHIIPCRIPSAPLSLEQAFILQKKISAEVRNKLVLKTGLSSLEIERWFRRRRALGRPSTLTKFSESGWRFICYFTSTFLGFLTLWGQPWAWDPNARWSNYPNINITTEMRAYYLYGVGLYLSFLFTQFSDVKRKDFWEMFVHHIITLTLLGVGWKINITRLAVLTLVLHDCSDVFLEVAKMSKYAKRHDLANGIFVVFILVWTVTRLIIYPKTILLEDGLYLFQNELLPKQVLFPLIGLGTLLFCLHIFWTYYICKVVVNAFRTKSENNKDARSSTESDSEDDDPISSVTPNSAETVKNQEVMLRNEEM